MGKKYKAVIVHRIFLKLLFCVFIAILIFGINSCNDEKEHIIAKQADTFLRSCDLSYLPQIRANGVVCKNADGNIEDMLLTLKNAGMNTVRLRIWHTPTTSNSGFEEVKNLSAEIKSLGLKVWLTVHYSDTWADPGAQAKPKSWESATYQQLKDSVYNYTNRIMKEINPEFIQIGNEINNGLLFPDGSYTNLSQMSGLLASGIKAVRDNNKATKIILHYAGHEKAFDFFSLFNSLDYDIIGISYYPLWHGKDLLQLNSNINQLGNVLQKKVVLAETSYPFTFGWNDYTNNVIGSSDQILVQFSATPEGQKDYLLSIKNMLLNSPNAIGFSYWGGEWISFKGNIAKDGSSWENQALWDFNLKSLPALEAFKQ